MSRSLRSLMRGTAAAVLAVTALTSPAAAVGSAPEAALRQPTPQPMRKLPNADDFVLTWDGSDVTGDPYADLIHDLRDDLGLGPLEYTNPTEFLAAATRHATRNCPRAMQNDGALRLGSDRVVTQNWFCLEKADATVKKKLNEPRWVTQGVSGTATRPSPVRPPSRTSPGRGSRTSTGSARRPPATRSCSGRSPSIPVRGTTSGNAFSTGSRPDHRRRRTTT
ncbi:hypothetical protein [Nonomuraea rhodomycinica]|uniref:CAP domain-containing protein n=1 Tax=Nonomuraea rhodomycinica TaxID=1712872 RepID=A0A7Y6IU56_9ACTN|nr:hypothetical protein [Nonomuraea rhodomycinica]NUW44459.1 hypothetical protein [Nonomuraea rhodomycinica]